jgi:hypothetical protein
LADKENSQSDANRSKKAVSEPELPKSDQKELAIIASKFTYMSFFWLRKPEYTFKLDLDPEYDPAGQFDDIADNCYEQFLELRAAIPEKWHNDMKEDTFISFVSIKTYKNFKV